MGRLLVVLGFVLLVVVVVALVAYFALVPPASRWVPPDWFSSIARSSVFLIWGALIAGVVAIFLTLQKLM